MGVISELVTITIIIGTPTKTLNSLNHYILYSEMIIPGSNYWTVAHGMSPGEMEKDGEGKQIMEVLGRNMAWLLRVMEAGRKEIPPPGPVAKISTNFIR
jgi:multimeric flavodoxin WrbA